MSYWFRPKSYGYGATPANWKGWAATAAFVAILVGFSLLLLASEKNSPTGPDSWNFVAWVALASAATWAFVRLARAKTDGQWAWRWGK
jgi:hypothetical protein